MYCCYFKQVSDQHCLYLPPCFYRLHTVLGKKVTSDIWKVKTILRVPPNNCLFLCLRPERRRSTPEQWQTGIIFFHHSCSTCLTQNPVWHVHVLEAAFPIPTLEPMTQEMLCKLKEVAGGELHSNWLACTVEEKRGGVDHCTSETLRGRRKCCGSSVHKRGNAQSR